jgi:hypothetical protein
MHLADRCRREAMSAELAMSSWDCPFTVKDAIASRRLLSNSSEFDQIRERTTVQIEYGVALSGPTPRRTVLKSSP